jgi:hypothetical protein
MSLIRQLNELLDEESYPGNIGMIEMVKFYNIATAEQKRKMKDLIASKKFDAAWDFLQQVTGVKLH